MTKMGFKKQTLDNWLVPDEMSCMFVRISPADGQIHPVKSEDWVLAILQPHLEETVPIEVQRLFEVARGVFIYGYFFYPLYALAAEQLSRVAEAAVTHKCRAVEAPRSVKTFKDKVDFLIDQRIISEQERMFWNATRKFRNSASHPERQSIFIPGPVIGILERVAGKINALFES